MKGLKGLKKIKIPAADLKKQDGRIRISPRAKLLAEEKGIQLNNIKGSGPNGRIITSDIEKASQFVQLQQLL